jgi:hypothetical protein
LLVRSTPSGSSPASRNETQSSPRTAHHMRLSPSAPRHIHLILAPAHPLILAPAHPPHSVISYTAPPTQFDPIPYQEQSIVHALPPSPPCPYLVSPFHSSTPQHSPHWLPPILERQAPRTTLSHRLNALPCLPLRCSAPPRSYRLIILAVSLLNSNRFLVPLDLSLAIQTRSRPEPNRPDRTHFKLLSLYSSPTTCCLRKSHADGGSGRPAGPRYEGWTGCGADMAGATAIVVGWS